MPMNITHDRSLSLQISDVTVHNLSAATRWLQISTVRRPSFPELILSSLRNWKGLRGVTCGVKTSFQHFQKAYTDVFFALTKVGE